MWSEKIILYLFIYSFKFITLFVYIFIIFIIIIIFSPLGKRYTTRNKQNKYNIAHLFRGQDTYKNSGSHVGPSGANFGRPHQIPVAHLIAYIFPSYVKT